MIAHTTLPVSDYKKSKEFYGRVLEPLGYHLEMEYGEAAGFKDGTKEKSNTDFWIAVNSKGVVPLHLAFAAKNKKEVEAFYQAALAAGGKDNGAPGYRPDYWPGYYAAFAHDLDGHNIEAVYYDYSKIKAAK